MGVNLPAHLVVIKSTLHYIGGMFQECSESQILQMIGRAGRPQFDTTATAVIMTRNSTKAKYEALLSGNQLIESSLHHNLIEHLNAEVVLQTITDVSIALEWLRSTFFYIRVKKNPKHYGMPVEYQKMEEKLQQLCLKNLQELESCSLVKMSDGFILQHTELGRLMARYCVAFESMKRFLSFRGKETLADLVNELSQCKEFADVRLRVTEKRVLNTLNKDKVKPTIRFQLPGKIKSTDMKVNCLIQATLGCLPVQEFALNQDTQKIFRAASRLSKCLMEVQLTQGKYQSLHSAVILHKCIQARLWEHSKHISKQLDKIGLTLSTTLVNAGLTSFEKLRATGPRELELIMNRHPPFGNQIRDAVALLPQYKLSVSQVSGVSGDRSELEVCVLLVNHEVLKEKGTTWGNVHTCMLLVGDADNTAICKQRISDSQLLGGGQYSRRLVVQRARAGDELKVHYVSLSRVGVDTQEAFTPKYTTTPTNHKPMKLVGHRPQSSSSSAATAATPRKAPETGVYYKPCNHRCLNKSVCGHDCCRNGIPVKPRGSAKPTPATKTASMSMLPARTPMKQKKADSRPQQSQSHRSTDTMSRYVNQLHAKATDLPATPALNRIKPTLSVNSTTGYGKGKQPLKHQFSYTPRPSMKYHDSQDSNHSTRTVPPSLHPEPQHSDDQEFWSSFCDTGEASWQEEWQREASIDLSELYDCESLQFEDEFYDPVHSEGSALPSTSSAYQPHSTTSGPPPPAASSSAGGRSCDANTESRVSEGSKHGGYGPPSLEEADSEDLEYSELERGVALLRKGRKRLIDEILEVEDENCLNTANTRYTQSSSSTITAGGNDNSWSTCSGGSKVQISASHPKLSCTDGFKWPRQSPTMSEMHGKPQSWKKVSSGTVPASTPVIPTQSAAPVTYADAIPAPPVPSTPAACTPVPVKCMSAPVTCSFFTAGSVDTNAEDEGENDIYGSVFAGIF